MTRAVERMRKDDARGRVVARGRVAARSDARARGVTREVENVGRGVERALFGPPPREVRYIAYIRASARVGAR
jgi:hypothetical protein